MARTNARPRKHDTILQSFEKRSSGGSEGLPAIEMDRSSASSRGEKVSPMGKAELWARRRRASKQKSVAMRLTCELVHVREEASLRQNVQAFAAGQKTRSGAGMNHQRSRTARSHELARTGSQGSIAKPLPPEPKTLPQAGRPSSVIDGRRLQSSSRNTRRRWRSSTLLRGIMNVDALMRSRPSRNSRSAHRKMLTLQGRR